MKHGLILPGDKEPDMAHDKRLSGIKLQLALSKELLIKHNKLVDKWKKSGQTHTNGPILLLNSDNQE